MTDQPPSTSSAALTLADWMRSYFLPRGPWAHPDNRLDVAAKLQEFADNAVAFAAQVVAAERTKPAAGDREAAMALMRKLGGGFNEQEWVATVAAALAERGEREREACAKLVEKHKPALKDAQSTWRRVTFTMLAAAIRNQTGD